MRKNNHFLWAIIDDGVNTTHPAKAGDIQIDGDGDVSERQDTGTLNHASRCFYIIQSYVPDIPPFVSIKVLSEKTERGDKNALVRALYWCLEHSVRLVHMSIGTTDPYDFPEIQRVIGLLAENGVIVVAAASNSGKQTYPAYDPRVIGVACDPALWERQWVYAPNGLNGMQFYASAAHNIKTPDGAYVTPVSNSFAAPLITAEILSGWDQLEKFCLDGVLLYLQKKAFGTSYDYFGDRQPAGQESTLVCFTGKAGAETETVLSQMRELFSRDGYFCRVVTIPPALSRDAVSFVRWASCFYMTDVLLFVVPLNQAKELQGLADLFVADQNSVPAGSLQPILSVDFSNLGNLGYIQRLYQDIVGILT